jgi:hypothetical protein
LFYIWNAADFSTKFFYGFSRKSLREKTQTVLSPLAPIKIFIFLAFELPSGNHNFFIARAADSSKKADLSQPHPSSSTNWWNFELNSASITEVRLFTMTERECKARDELRALLIDVVG